ncbi:MAG: cupin domain-containing protein [Nitrospirae bacterium]|nr:cupin domain-containing protein [Nitrospirota bacterium]
MFIQSPALGDDYKNVTVSLIKKTGSTTDGQKITYPKTDSPEVTALTVEIPPGGETGWHMHPVPVYAYMISGSITVEMEKGEKYSFTEGDAIFEVMNTAHNGRNYGKSPAKLAVFYLGVEGGQNTIRVQHKKDKE